MVPILALLILNAFAISMMAVLIINLIDQERSALSDLSDKLATAEPSGEAGSDKAGE